MSDNFLKWDLSCGVEKNERTVNSKAGNNFSKYRLRLHVAFIGSGKELLFASKLPWSSWLKKVGLVFENLLNSSTGLLRVFLIIIIKKKIHETTYY